MKLQLIIDDPTEAIGVMHWTDKIKEAAIAELMEHMEIFYTRDALKRLVEKNYVQ